MNSMAFYSVQNCKLCPEVERLRLDNISRLPTDNTSCGASKGSPDRTLWNMIQEKCYSVKLWS
jgi:hypothetical protein